MLVGGDFVAAEGEVDARVAALAHAGLVHPELAAWVRAHPCVVLGAGVVERPRREVGAVACARDSAPKNPGRIKAGVG